MPEKPADILGRYVTSYAHIGQHGGASRTIVDRTRPASGTKIACLQSELEGIGYNLEIRQRITAAMDRQRLAAASA